MTIELNTDEHEELLFCIAYRMNAISKKMLLPLEEDHLTDYNNEFDMLAGLKRKLQ